ncbi:hypothetical protein BGZ63DRAFT_197559 [Mariannaea sp. PMI_226]|nr:hypothetical protein BGZ63DRAFT_197559 [Mariannaea sp. PMI_226]
MSCPYLPQLVAKAGPTNNSNQWIEVRRHYQIPSVEDDRRRQQYQQYPNPTSTQQTISASEIIGWVHQHGRDDPWDGIAMVQASRATTASWYNTQPRYNTQHGNFNGQYPPSGWSNVAYQQDNGADAVSPQQDHGNDTDHHVSNLPSTSSTQAEHGSRQTELPASSRQEGRHRHRKPRAHA